MNSGHVISRYSTAFIKTALRCLVTALSLGCGTASAQSVTLEQLSNSIRVVCLQQLPNIRLIQDRNRHDVLRVPEKHNGQRRHPSVVIIYNENRCGWSFRANQGSYTGDYRQTSAPTPFTFEVEGLDLPRIFEESVVLDAFYELVRNCDQNWDVNASQTISDADADCIRTSIGVLRSSSIFVYIYVSQNEHVLTLMVEGRIFSHGIFLDPN
jgi:hypothetical protein